MHDARSQFRFGLIYGLIAYTIWGLIPVYFHAMSGVFAGEILAHRIVWSFPIVLTLVALQPGGWATFTGVLRDRRLVLTLLLSATLLAINWLLYIYATVVGKVVEGSLGYYMLPLVNAFLGTVFLGEKLRPAHYPALAIIVLGLCVPFVVAGKFTWLAVTLPVTFGLYGFVRKAIPVDSLSGLTVESLMMVPFAVGGLIYLGSQGEGHFGLSWGLNALLAFSGIVTVAPLLTYIMSIRRLPLVAMSFLQFISPTTQLMIALFFLGETPPWYVWVACACVWVSVLIFLGDAAWQYYGTRKRKAATASELRSPILVSAKV